MSNIIFPGTIAQSNYTGQTSSIGTTTLLTVPGASMGLFGLYINIIVTAAATGSVTGFVTYNNGSATNTATTGAIDTSILGTDSHGTPQFFAAENATNITFHTTLVGSATYTFTILLVYFGTGS